MNEWVLILGMALVTFLPRYLPLALAGRVILPDWLIQALSFVPIAVLSAIVAQVAMVRDQAVHLDPLNPQLWAAIAAGLTAMAGRSLLMVIIVGLMVYAGLISVL